MTPGYFHDHVAPFAVDQIQHAYMVHLAADYYCCIEPVGSRHTNGDGHDQDYLVWTPLGQLPHVEADLLDCGWTPESGQLEYRPEGSAANDAPFGSWRKGELNIILTDRREFAELHRLGTAVLKQIKLDDKDARKYVMYAILYGEMWCGPGVLKTFGSRDDL